MSDQSELRSKIVEVCHRLCDHGYVAATDGNVSARLGNGHVLTTRTAINKGMVTQADIVEVDLSGTVIGSTHWPSTELPMHLFIYKSRPDEIGRAHV
jgi:L-fuculose-phosphate aldolase